MPRRPPLRAALLLVGVVALAGCSSGQGRSPVPSATGPVAVPVPINDSARVAAACRALIRSLPDELDDGVRRRPVSTDPDRTAAWGDPPVLLRCGVPPPGSVMVPLVIDGLPLVPQEATRDVTYTTSDRAVNVSLQVPRSYESQAYLFLRLIPVLRQLPARPTPSPTG